MKHRDKKIEDKGFAINKVILSCDDYSVISNLYNGFKNNSLKMIDLLDLVDDESMDEMNKYLYTYSCPDEWIIMNTIITGTFLVVEYYSVTPNEAFWKRFCTNNNVTLVHTFCSIKPSYEYVGLNSFSNNEMTTALLYELEDVDLKDFLKSLIASGFPEEANELENRSLDSKILTMKKPYNIKK